MNATAPRIAPGPAVLDRVTSLLGITAAWSLAAMLAAFARPLHPALYLSGFGLAVAAHLAHAARCRSRAPRVRSLAGFLWAPAGRIRRIPAGTPLLAAKRYYFNPSQAYHPMLVWVGWWNCRTFTGDPASAEYFFVERGSTRYAVPACDLVQAG
jgi:L-alanine-DL-glutamate epimerase-like enolase superfamily enzyme